MLFHFVSNAPHHLDVIWLLGIELDLFPNAPDVDHHRVFAGVGRLPVPHPAVDLLRREDAAGVTHQQVHDLCLRSGELHRFPIRPQFPAVRVVGEAPVDDEALPLLRVDVPQQGVPPQLAPDSGRQLLGVEGLGHIVVRPHGEAQDLVRVLTFGGEDDHRQVPLFPDPQQSGQPIQLGHHHVDEDQPHRRVQGQIQSLHAVIGPQDPVALPLQGDGDGPHDLRIVVHHQNARVHLDPSLS